MTVKEFIHNNKDKYEFIEINIDWEGPLRQRFFCTIKGKNPSYTVYEVEPFRSSDCRELKDVRDFSFFDCYGDIYNINEENSTGELGVSVHVKG